MKPDYDAMSWSELRAYILQNRDDIDALEAFFARRSPDSEATWFTPPKTEEEWQQQLEVIRPILERKSSKANDKATVIKGTIKDKSIILIDALPEGIQDGNEVEIVVTPIAKHKYPFPTFELGIQETSLNRDELYESD